MVREEMGRIPGTIALFGCFLIMIIILAVLALIVVKALAESPWGMFTVMATIPIAMFMGIYMRYIRPGRIGEISVVGSCCCCSVDLAGRAECRGSGLGQGLHLHRHADHLDAGRLRFRRRGIAGLADPGAARLPVHLPEDRHHHRPGDRHPDRDARAENAGADPVHRRHRAGVEGRPVPVPVHHHRLWCGLGFPRADLLRHHAQAAGQRRPTPATSATAAC